MKLHLAHSKTTFSLNTLPTDLQRLIIPGDEQFSITYRTAVTLVQPVDKRQLKEETARTDRQQRTEGPSSGVRDAETQLTTAAGYFALSQSLRLTEQMAHKVRITEKGH